VLVNLKAKGRLRIGDIKEAHFVIRCVQFELVTIVTGRPASCKIRRCKGTTFF
jgi:hypothetical protein